MNLFSFMVFVNSLNLFQQFIGLKSFVIYYGEMAVDNFTIKSLSSLLSSLLALAFPLALMALESRTVVVMMMKTKVVDGADE